MELAWEIFQWILMLSGSFFTLFGLFIFFHIFVKGAKKPADTSNRINKFRLFWFAITRPELFVDTFEWMKNDELDNMKR